MSTEGLTNTMSHQIRVDMTNSNIMEDRFGERNQSSSTIQNNNEAKG